MSARKKIKNGFTLVEIMVAIAVFSLTSYMLFQYLRDTSAVLYNTQYKTYVNGSVRKLTNLLTQSTREANYKYVLTGYVPGANAESAAVAEAQSGDFLLLVRLQALDTNPGRLCYISKIRGFFRGTDGSGTGAGDLPVMWFEIDYGTDQTKWVLVKTSAADPTMLAQVLTLVNAKNFKCKTLATLAAGLVNQKMFYVLDASSVMVKAQIKEGNMKDKRQAIITNTYNLTVSTRG